MISGKVTLHIGKRFSQRHNTNMEYRKHEAERELARDNETHIDICRIEQNEILENHEMYDFFNNEFGDAIMDFNEKNKSKHSDRCIGGIKNINNREKCVKAYLREHKKDCQEAIIQLSDSNNFKKMCDELGYNKAVENHKQFLKETYTNFKENYPSLKVISATIHCDESVPHLHLDFIPVTTSSRGLSVKISMDGALREIGYKRCKSERYSETVYKSWLADARLANEKIASKYINIVHSEPSVRGHLEYYQHKYLIEQKSALKRLVERFKDKQDVETAKQLINAANDLSKAITSEANEQLENVKIKDIKLQKKVADAQEFLKNADKKKAQISSQNEKLNTRAEQLNKKEKELYKRSQMLDIEARYKAEQLLKKSGYTKKLTQDMMRTEISKTIQKNK